MRILLVAFTAFALALVPGKVGGEPEPCSGITNTLVRLYNDEDQGVRLTAMLFSVGIVQNRPLVEELRKRLPETPDPLERAVMAYSAAAMSMRDEDIQAFFHHFPGDAHTLWRLEHVQSAGFVEHYSDRDIATFLLKLARDERYRDEAAILAMIMGNVIGGEEDNFIYQDRVVAALPQGVIAEYRRRSEQFDINDWDNTFYPDSKGKTKVWNAIDACMDSPDRNTRITAMLMSTNYCYPGRSTRQKLMERRANLSLSSEEAAIIDHVLFSCNWSYLARAPDEAMANAVRSLPESKEGVERLLKLESETYKRASFDHGSFNDNIVQRLGSLCMHSAPCARKLDALLRHGKAFVRPDEETCLRKRIEGFGYVR